MSLVEETPILRLEHLPAHLPAAAPLSQAGGELLLLLLLVRQRRTAGTTHMHNLLSKDPAFIYCNTFQVGFPNTFYL